MAQFSSLISSDICLCTVPIKTKLHWQWQLSAGELIEVCHAVTATWYFW